MGSFVNPSGEGFATILRGEYVDKTGLLRLFDAALDTPDKLVLVSRPRRFGKSFAAQMVSAFYTAGEDTRSLFEGLEVSRRTGWDRNLNRFNVVRLDMASVIQSSGAAHVVPEVVRMLLPELRDLVPNAGKRDEGYGNELKSALADVVRATGCKFVFVVDEWDAPYRLAPDDKPAQDVYAEWLRALFKDLSFTPDVVAGAYLTGILPIKKYNHQSAVSDFQEYTMVDAGQYAPYVGFCENEVKMLCRKRGLDVSDVRKWYDGYSLPHARHIYAPYSVMRAYDRGKTGSYWVSTEAFRSLRPYIEMDFDGLQTDLVRAVGGLAIDVDPDGFQNDMTTIDAKDDVLALLIHLGYLAFDAALRTASVPNDEVRLELARALSKSTHPKLVELLHESVRLLADIVAMREEAVAEGFQRVHERDCSPLFYNNEQALRAVVKSALVAAIDGYARIEEMPGGKGFADVAYLPAKGSMRPALLVELKWDKPAQTALSQIHGRRYPEVLCGLNVPVLLVGVSYDAKTREHSCRIELLEEAGS